MNALEKYLKDQFFISNENLKVIAPEFKKLELAKGDYFIKMGRVADRMAFIESGLIRIYAEAESAEK